MIIYTTGPKLARLAGQYGPLVPALRELILRPDTPLEAGVKDMIAGQLDAARDRFAAIGPGRDGDSTAGPPFGAQPGPAWQLPPEPPGPGQAHANDHPGKAGAQASRFTMPGPGDRGGGPACRGEAADVAGQQYPGRNPCGPV